MLEKTQFLLWSDDEYDDIRDNGYYKNIGHDITIMTDYGFITNGSRNLNFQYMRQHEIDSVQKGRLGKEYFFLNNMKLHGDVFKRIHCLSNVFSSKGVLDSFEKRHSAIKYVLELLSKNKS